MGWQPGLAAAEVAGSLRAGRGSSAVMQHSLMCCLALRLSAGGSDGEAHRPPLLLSASAPCCCSDNPLHHLSHSRQRAHTADQGQRLGGGGGC